MDCRFLKNVNNERKKKRNNDSMGRETARGVFMLTRTLGRTSLEVSVIGFGGIPIQRLAMQDAVKVLHKALDQEINFFDTARGYTDSEEKIGQALSKARDGIYLASKAMSRDAVGMTKEIETSLRNLRVETIDLYQVHALGSFEQLEEVLSPHGAYSALDNARKQGKIRYLGVTGHVREVLCKAIKTGLFDTAQFPYNPIETEWEEEALPEAKKRGLGVIGMKPVAGGALRSVGAALKFSLHRGIDVVIPGMDSISQVVENASIGKQLLPPDQDDMLSLDKERRLWGDRFCRRCGYCMPCQNGLDIPTLLLLQAYHQRYGLVDWAKNRLEALSKSYTDCQACGDCLSRCPYELPIPELIQQAATEMLSD